MTPPKKTDAKKTDAKKPAAKTAAKAPALPSMANLLKVAGTALPQVDDPTKVCWYPTGNLTFDALTANGHPVPGGLPGGRVVEFSGMESSGKTTLSLQAAARMQREQGKVVVFMDYERAFDKSYAHSLGVDTTLIEDGGLFWYLTPDYLEQGFDIVETFCRDAAWKDRVGMFILDSIPAMPSVLMKDEKDEHETLGLQARQLSRLMPGLTHKLAETDAVAVFINQMRMNPAAKGNQKKTTTPGGTAFKFYASLRVELRKTSNIPAKVWNPYLGVYEDGSIGHFVSMSVLKNKVSGEFRYAPQVPIIQNLGVDNVWDCINYLRNVGIIQLAGSWLVIPKEVAGSVEDVKAQGAVALRDTLNLTDSVRANVVAFAERTLRENFAKLQSDRLEGRGIFLDAAEVVASPDDKPVEGEEPDAA